MDTTTNIIARAIDTDNEIETLSNGLVPFGWYGGALPSSFEINTTLYYDTSLLEYFAGSHNDVKSWIYSVVEFTKVKLGQPSLAVHLKLKVGWNLIY